jgi:hypothetical protein
MFFKFFCFAFHSQFSLHYLKAASNNHVTPWILCHLEISSSRLISPLLLNSASKSQDTDKI